MAARWYARICRTLVILSVSHSEIFPHDFDATFYQVRRMMITARASSVCLSLDTHTGV